ncbi:MAG TPA: 5-guanidino-2-oxopentanoate decarboxylase [Steroidobacteraceae bacterium]|jgi:thiamine pyrophosphate-dependent acetolactate synthase large subunit-like protein|nr:5-guanidino-2-oxopentanoate decarboxylase [Steroidobacteraceae bacterium]
MPVNSMTCGEAVMRLLSAYDVDTVFGMAGTMTVELYRGIGRAGIRHVQCRNEQGASLMADGYARSTGKPGVCTIIAGPGVTNAATGIAQAYCDSQPMLVLSGAAATRTHGKGWGAIHELNDQAAVTAGFTALSAMVRYPEELPELIARAYAVFRGRRPRPVHLSLPRDMLPETVEADWQPRRSPSLPMPDPRSIEEAADLLAQAGQPLIFVGGGAAGGGKALAEIAERIGAPVLSTNAGKGILPESHPLSLGCSVLQDPSREALAGADVVLVVGSEVGMGDHFLAKLEITGDIIRIDIDPEELTSVYAAAVPIQSDARAALRALSDALASRTPKSRRAQGEARVRRVLESNSAKMSDLERLHARVWKILRSALPADTIVMGDASQIVYTGCFAMPMERERCWYYSGTYCALGVALPLAIGAKIGAPDRPVVAVAGDGGIMFTVSELATAAEERIALPVIVWNNDALKEIVDQMDSRGIPRIGVEPKSPDFLRLAQSLGCHAVRPAGAEQLALAVRDALVADRPTLIEVRQDSPWLGE